MIGDFKGIEPVFGKTVYIHPSAVVSGRVTLKEYVSIWFNASLRGDVGEIVIGNYSNIQDNCVLHNSTNVSVIIGDYVTVGHGAILHSCEIGDQTLVGMGSIILDHVTIGKNCLIGAGSLVTPNQVIPDNSLVLGSPAKVVRTLTEEEVKKHKANAVHYVQLGKEYMDW